MNVDTSILGYSERGIVSSVFFEIAYSNQPHELLSRFLNLITFPFTNLSITDIQKSKVLIEQSFSDFGDSDSLLHLNMNGKNISMFFEAKVKPIQRKDWLISDEWNKFSAGTRKHVSSSNLFVQLYHKVRLVEGLSKTGIAGLQSGLKFPQCSTKSLRKIGSNQVVLEAVNILQEYIDAVYYVALIPDTIKRSGIFFDQVLRNSQPVSFTGWNVGHFGYLTWEEVERFSKENSLQNILKVFKHNRGQIYKYP